MVKKVLLAKAAKKAEEEPQTSASPEAKEIIQGIENEIENNETRRSPSLKEEIEEQQEKEQSPMKSSKASSPASPMGKLWWLL